MNPSLGILRTSKTAPNSLERPILMSFQSLATCLRLASVGLTFAAIAGGVDSRDCYADLAGDLCDSYGDYQGLSFTAIVTRNIGGDKSDPHRAFDRELKIRYRVGFRESNDVIPPYSLESLIKNPGEPHLRDPEIAEWWTAFDGRRICRFKRRFLTGTGDRPPKRHLSEGNLFNTVQDQSVELLINEAFHVGPHGQSNHRFVGNFSQSLEKIDARVVGEEQREGYVMTDLKLTSRVEGFEGNGYTLAVAVGPTAFIAGVKNVHGKGEAPPAALANRVVERFKIIEGFLLPMKMQWEQKQPFSTYRLEIIEVERLPRDFIGLWAFDRPTGTKFIKNFKDVQPYYVVPFTKEQEDAIRVYEASFDAAVENTKDDTPDN